MPASLRCKASDRHGKEVCEEFLLAAVSLGFGIRNGLKDLKYPDIFDVPVMEGLLGVITLFGAYLVACTN